MCVDCVIEEAGPPEQWPDRTPLMTAVSNAIADLYQEDGCSVGGPLHIVVDDFNTEDHNIMWCLNHSQRSEWDVEAWNAACAVAWGLLSIHDNTERLVAIHDAHALGWVTA